MPTNLKISKESDIFYIRIVRTEIIGNELIFNGVQLAAKGTRDRVFEILKKDSTNFYTVNNRLVCECADSCRSSLWAFVERHVDNGIGPLFGNAASYIWASDIEQAVNLIAPLFKKGKSIIYKSWYTHQDGILYTDVVPEAKVKRLQRLTKRSIK